MSGPLVNSEVEDCENHEGQNSCCGDRVEKLENQQKSANNKISLVLQDREVDKVDKGFCCDVLRK